MSSFEKTRITQVSEVIIEQRTKTVSTLIGTEINLIKINETESLILYTIDSTTKKPSSVQVTNCRKIK